MRALVVFFILTGWTALGAAPAGASPPLYASREVAKGEDFSGWLGPLLPNWEEIAAWLSGCGLHEASAESTADTARATPGCDNCGAAGDRAGVTVDPNG